MPVDWNVLFAHFTLSALLHELEPFRGLLDLERFGNPLDKTSFMQIFNASYTFARRRELQMVVIFSLEANSALLFEDFTSCRIEIRDY
jgi:hypothetical protein